MSKKEFSLIFDAKELRDAVNIVDKAVDFRSRIPILRNLLFQFDEDEVTISATDQKIWISLQMEILVDSGISFDVTVPQKIFQNVLKGKKGDIDFSVLQDSDGCLEIKIGDISIQGIDAEDFPPVPQSDKDNKDFKKMNFAISKKILKTVIDKTILATNVNDPRMWTNGVYFTGDSFTATCGNILFSLITENHSIPKGFDLLVPVRTLQLISGIIGKKKSDLEGDAIVILHTNMSVMFFLDHTQFGNVKLISRSLSTRYPNWNKKSVNPDYRKNNSWYVTFSCEELRQVLKNALPFSETTHKYDNKITLTIEANKKIATITADETDAGKFKKSIEVEVEGEIADHAKSNPFIINFNAQSMLDILKLPEEVTEIDLRIRSATDVIKVVTSYEGIAEETCLLAVI